MKKILIATAIFAVALVVWNILFQKFSHSEQILFPGNAYQVYAVTDEDMGGFSTSELSEDDSSITAKVNIRSGVAYAHAGIGFNLLSVNNRPANFFDFSAYDSLLVDVETNRMRHVNLKILNNDPVYSQEGVAVSYRPMEVAMTVGKNAVGIPMARFKVSEWWLALQGLEEDDGLRYMQRGALFEIYNGDGTLRGIPDEITVRSIKLWGENRTFKSLMFIVLALIIAAYGGSIFLGFRHLESRLRFKEAAEKNQKTQMQKAAELLKNSDRSVAEIALAVGEKNASLLEKHFEKVYGVKPLEYRKRK